ARPTRPPQGHQGWTSATHEVSYVHHQQGDHDHRGGDRDGDTPVGDEGSHHPRDKPDDQCDGRQTTEVLQEFAAGDRVESGEEHHDADHGVQDGLSIQQEQGQGQGQQEQRGTQGHPQVLETVGALPTGSVGQVRCLEVLGRQGHQGCVAFQSPQMGFTFVGGKDSCLVDLCVLVLQLLDPIGVLLGPGPGGGLTCQHHAGRVQAAQFVTATHDVGVQFAQTLVERVHVGTQFAAGGRLGGGDLLQPDPGQWVGPRSADGAVTFVTGAAGGALTFEEVAGVSRPQSTKATYPRGPVVDEDGTPLTVTAGAEPFPVATGVVDEGHPDPVSVDGTVGGQEFSAQSAPGADQAAQEGRVHLDEVVAREHLVGVGARSDVDDRVEAVLVQVGVVPTSAQVVTVVFVRGRADPHGSGGAVLLLHHVDGDTFPVRLVVVDPAVAGAPVVHGVEEQVLQGDVDALTDDPAVVGDVSVIHAFAVAGHGGEGDAARDGAPDEQGQFHQDVEDPAEHTDGGQATALGDDRARDSLESARLLPQ